MLAVFAFVVLTVLPGAAQRRTLDLEEQPWRTVMDTWHAHGESAALPAIEAIGSRTGDATLRPWQRAHAWRWAGEIAKRGLQLTRARTDYTQAIALDHDGYEGRMSRVGLGEVAILEHRWGDARGNLARVVNDPDPLIAFYARDRMRTVDEHGTRSGLRRVAIAAIVCTLALLAWLAVGAARAGFARSFGRALLVTEALALAAALLAPRWNPLAQSGVTAGAIPCAVLGAVAWATVGRSGTWAARAIALVAWIACIVAAVYLALDLLWWSVERPIP